MQAGSRQRTGTGKPTADGPSSRTLILCLSIVALTWIVVQLALAFILPGRQAASMPQLLLPPLAAGAIVVLRRWVRRLLVARLRAHAVGGGTPTDSSS